MTSHILGEEVNPVRAWKLHEAKARFSELLDTVKRKGPQVVTRKGEAVAVVVPIDEWQRVQEAARPDLKTLLLAPEPRFDDLIPDRHRPKRHRPPVEFT